MDVRPGRKFQEQPRYPLTDINMPQMNGLIHPSRQRAISVLSYHFLTGYDDF